MVAKNQHYVPQFYLSQWSPPDSEKAIVDRLDLKSGETKALPVRRVLAEKFFYETEETETNKIEKALAELEGKKFAPKIREAIAWGHTWFFCRRRTIFTHWDRAEWAFLLLNQLFRTRSFRERSKHIHELLNREQLDVEIPISAEDHHAERLLSMETYLQPVAYWASFRFGLRRAPMGRRWLTSDSPVVLRYDSRYGKNGLGPGKPIIQFPLSPKWYLVAQPKDCRLPWTGDYRLATDDEIDFLNWCQGVHAHRWLVSRPAEYEEIELSLEETPELMKASRELAY